MKQSRRHRSSKTSIRPFKSSVLTSWSSGKRTTIHGLKAKGGIEMILNALSRRLPRVSRSERLSTALTDYFKQDPSFADVKAQLQSEERRNAAGDEFVEVASKGRATFIALGIWIENAAHHWRVQLILVCEEMRCSLEFAKWKAEKWRQDAIAGNSDEAKTEGQRAYAMKHAEAYDHVRTKWAEKWYPLVGEAKKTNFKHDIVDLGFTAAPLTSNKVVIEFDDSDDEHDYRDRDDAGTDKDEDQDEDEDEDAFITESIDSVGDDSEVC
jgi:hypothetical protein